MPEHFPVLGQTSCGGISANLEMLSRTFSLAFKKEVAWSLDVYSIYRLDSSLLSFVYEFVGNVEVLLNISRVGRFVGFKW